LELNRPLKKKSNAVLGGPSLSVRPNLWLGLYGSLIAVVIPSFFLEYPIPEMYEKSAALAAAFFLLMAITQIGQTILHFLLPKNQQEPLHPLWHLNFGLGLGCLALGSVILGLGWLVPGSLSIKLRILKFSLLVPFAWGLVRAWKSRSAINLIKIEPLTVMEILWTIMAAGGIVFTFITCFSPITYYDSLVYHLGLPNTYILNDRIGAVPFNLYSYFPANTEMIFLFVLSQLPQPDYTINLFCFALSFSLSLGLLAWIRHETKRIYGLSAMGLWWTMPAVVFLSVGAYVDIALAFFIFLAVYGFLKSIQTSSSYGWMAISGLMAGTAMATK